MTQSTALLIVGMSASDVAQSDEILRAARDVDPEASVAFLQMGDPSVSRELTRLADRSIENITVVGISLGVLGPAHSWLRRIVGHWWRERTDNRPRVSVATRLARDLGSLATVLTDLKPIHGSEAGIASAAWDDVPGHRHQVLVCRGPRCSARGSDETAQLLDQRLKHHGLGDDDVLVTQTGCQFPCNQAPVVSVQPDDVWYGQVVPEVVDSLVTEHLMAGRPLNAHRLPRNA